MEEKKISFKDALDALPKTNFDELLSKKQKGWPEEAEHLNKWSEQIFDEYNICFCEGLFEENKNREPVESPMGGIWNHLIAVVFHQVRIDEKTTEFYIDKNGLHFNKYKYDLTTSENGSQVHLVYLCETEALLWVETKGFHKGSMFEHKRYIKGSERSYFHLDWDEIW